MTFPGDALPTPSEFIRRDLTWTLGLLPFVIAGLRVMVMSDGDGEVLDALLHNLNVTGLVLSTVLPCITMLSVWYLAGWFQFLRPKDMKSAQWTISQGLWLMVAAVAFIVAQENSLSTLLISGVFIAFQVILHRRASGRSVLAALPFFVASLLMVAMIHQSWWLPAEIIHVKGRDAEVGYVLATDPQWTTYLIGVNKVLRIDRTNLIESREPCTTVTSWFERPIATLAYPLGKVCPRRP